MTRVLVCASASLLVNARHDPFDSKLFLKRKHFRFEYKFLAQKSDASCVCEIQEAELCKQRAVHDFFEESSCLSECAH